MEDWGRPLREPTTMEANQDLSCWNCEHLQVGTMFNRRCPKHPESYIWGPTAQNERQETGCVVAESCQDFQWASEFVRFNPQLYK